MNFGKALKSAGNSGVHPWEGLKGLNEKSYKELANPPTPEDASLITDRISSPQHFSAKESPPLPTSYLLRQY